MGDFAALIERARQRVEADPELQAQLEREVAMLPPRPAEVCPLCDGARFVLGARVPAGSGARLEGAPPSVRQVIPCVCARTEDPQRLLDRSGLPPAMRGWSFETFPARDGKVDALRAVTGAVERIANGDACSLALVGGNGRGKSGLAAAIVHALCLRGIGARFVSVAQLLGDLRARMDGADGRPDALLQRYIAAPVLVLDDLAAPRGTDWAIETLTALVDGRLAAAHPTVVTLDVELRAVAEIFGTRIASRLRLFDWITVGGADLRAMRPAPVLQEVAHA